MVTKSSLCRDTPHNIVPTYKVIVHQEHGNDVYVFVGKLFMKEHGAILKQLEKETSNITADHGAKLSALFGRDWKKKLGIELGKRIVFIDEVLYDDDTIGEARAKIAKSMGLKGGHDIYMWCNRQIVDKSTFWNDVLEEWFNEERKLVMGGSLKALIGAVCGVEISALDDKGTIKDDTPVSLEQARSIIRYVTSGKGLNFVNIPLGFRYFQDGNGHVFFPVHPGMGASTHDPNMPLIVQLELKKHLEYYAPHMRVLHVVARNSLKDEQRDRILYFPKEVDAKLGGGGGGGSSDFTSIKRDDENFAVKYRDARTMYTSDCLIGFAQFRNIGGLPFEDIIVNIDRVFNDIEMDMDGVLFAKKITKGSGSMVKMIKKLALMPEVKSDLVNWSKLEVFKRNVLCDGIIMKVNVGRGANKAATLVVLANGACDLKISANNDFFMNENDCIDILEKINKVLGTKVLYNETGAQNVPMFDKNVLRVSPSMTTTRVMRMSVAGLHRTKGKVPDIQRVEAVLNGVGGVGGIYKRAFAHVETVGNIVNMIYRLVDDFGNDSQINAFISRYHKTIERSELMSRLMNVYGLNEVAAKSYLTGWRTRYKSEAFKLGFRASRWVGAAEGMGGFAQGAQFLNVRLYRTPTGYRLNCEGVTQLRYYKRILRLVKGLLVEAANKRISKKELDSGPKKMGVSNAAVANALNTKDEEADGDDDFDMLEVDNDILNDLGPDLNALLDGLQLQLNDADDGNLNVGNANVTHDNLDNQDTQDADDDEGDGDGGVAQGKGKTKASKEDLMKQYLLNELKKADKALFTVKGKREKYARICQKNTMRQPVVITREEHERFQAEAAHAGKGSRYASFIAQGSTEELKNKNIYICPDVWCPKSRVPMSRWQFKENGEKCPDRKVKEEPILFYVFRRKKGAKEDDLDPYNEGNISLFGPEHHQDQLQMPCCFAREKKESKNPGNVRYIMGRTIPVEENRYGLLPKAVNTFFGNVNIGGRYDGTGLVNKETDAFVRMGVAVRRHAFLYVMSEMLENDAIKDEAALIQAICDNLDMQTFMSLYNGFLFKKFVSLVDPKTVYDVDNYTRFKAWFVQQLDYTRSYSLDELRSYIIQGMNIGDFKPDVQVRVLREYVFWAAFESFKKFMTDDSIVKTHEFLLDLMNMSLSWLNVKGYNFLVLEYDEDTDSVYMPCSQASNIRDGKPFVILIKGGPFYEPIVHVKLKGSEIVVTSKFAHNLGGSGRGASQWPAIRKLYNYIRKSRVCMKSLVARTRVDEVAEAVRRVGSEVISYVLDYDFQVIALLLEGGILLPLPRQLALVPGERKKFMFLDQALAHKKLGEAGEEATRKLIAALNKDLKDDLLVLQDGSNAFGAYRVIPLKESKSKPDGKKAKRDSDGLLTFIPLQPIKEAAIVPLMRAMSDDLMMMVKVEQKDKRKEFIENNNMIDGLYKSLWNEVVSFIKRQKTVMDKVAFLRNPLNPIPMNHKMSILYEVLGDYMSRITEKRARSNGVETFQNKLCSSIGKHIECMGQCKWFDTRRDADVLGGKCKLVTPQNIYDQIVGKVLIDMLNVNVPLKTVNIVNRYNQEDVIVFSDGDIKTGQLLRLIQDHEEKDGWGFKRKDKVVKDDEFLGVGNNNANDDGIAENQRTSHAVVPLTKKMRPVPTGLRAELKGFFVNDWSDEYGATTMFDIFAPVYNTVVGAGGTLASLIDANKLRDMTVGRIVKEFEKDAVGTLKRLEYNPSLKSWFKKVGKGAKVTANDVDAAIRDGGYYPSKMDLEVIADLCHVNVLIWGRLTKRNAMNQWCHGRFNDALFTVLMEQTFKEKPGYDVYEPIVKGNGAGARVLLELDDIDSPAMRGTILEKCENKVILSPR